MDFAQQFAQVKMPLLKDYYIPYDHLYTLLKEADSDDECSSQFYQQLELSYTCCKNYAENWLNKILLGEIGNNVLEEVMELNGFISINQQALQYLIVIHDMKWRLDFHLTEKLITFVVDSGSFTPTQASMKSLSLPAEYLRPPTLSLDDLFHDSIIEEGKMETSCQSNEPSIQLSLFKKIVHDGSRRISLMPQQKSGFLRGLSLISNRGESFFVNDSTFTQYLVSSENLIPVIVLLSRYLPTKTGANLPSSASLMTSFYFDNENCDAYRHCLSPGILQSYGQAISLHQNQLDPEKISVHLSAHYRENQLLFDKFQVSLTDVSSFLTGEPIPVVPVNMVGACSQVQSLLSQKSYMPRIKATYTQFTFQSYAHDHIQMTLKFNYRLYDLSSRSSSSTAIHLDWIHDPSRYTSRDLLSFPWGVLEVRLKEPFVSTPPAFLDELLHAQMVFQPHTQTEIFSVYAHAVYSFHSRASIRAVGNPIDLPCPSWWEELNSQSSDPVNTFLPTRASPEHWFAKIVHAILSLNPNYNSPVDLSKEAKMSFQKIYFACERTFLSWLTSASYSVALGAVISNEPGTRLSGGLLVLGGVVIVGYAVVTYISRLMAIDKLKAVTDDVYLFDLYGPVFLSIFISVSWVISWLVLVEVL